MSNMPYCRFENTVGDLEDCLDHIEDDLGGDEYEARDELIRICVEIAKYRNHRFQDVDELEEEIYDEEDELEDGDEE